MRLQDIKTQLTRQIKVAKKELDWMQEPSPFTGKRHHLYLGEPRIPQVICLKAEIVVMTNIRESLNDNPSDFAIKEAKIFI